MNEFYYVPKMSSYIVTSIKSYFNPKDKIKVSSKNFIHYKKCEPINKSVHSYLNKICGSWRMKYLYYYYFNRTLSLVPDPKEYLKLTSIDTETLYWYRYASPGNTLISKYSIDNQIGLINQKTCEIRMEKEYESLL